MWFVRATSHSTDTSLTLILSLVLPKSVTPERVKSNFVTVDFTDEEIANLLKIAETDPYRACGPEWTGWGDLGFEDRKKA